MRIVVVGGDTDHIADVARELSEHDLAWRLDHVASEADVPAAGTDGAPLGMVSVGNQPYTYSDASGSTVIGQTSPSGSWTVTFDSGTAGSPWAPVWWNDSVPAGASLSVRVRTADTPADLPLKAWTSVTKGGPIALTGRYIEAQANFATTTGSPAAINASKARASTHLHS